MELDSLIAHIVAEAAKRRPDARSISAEWIDSDEAYRLLIDDASYTFQIGSDDDELYFVNDADWTDRLTLPMPEGL